MSDIFDKFSELCRQLDEINSGLNEYRNFLNDPTDECMAHILRDSLNIGYEFENFTYDDSEEILELTKCAVKILHKRYLIVCHELRKTLEKLEVAEENLRNDNS